MDHDSKAQALVQGAVAPGFESVKALLEQKMHACAEKNVQLCVYHKGDKVVDLWASTPDDNSFSADTLINVFSSGKSLAAIAMASLFDRGLIEYGQKVVTYWPEFGAHGKDDLTIADVLRHEAGLPSFDTSLELRDLFTENIKQNTVGAIIERQTQRYPADGSSKREYHAVTRGWILNEIFRRVDPARRTIGEYLREDISVPLAADAYIGLAKEQLPLVSPISPLGIVFQLVESLKPKIFGRRIVPNIFSILSLLFRLLPRLRNSQSRSSRPPFKGMKGIAFFNKPAVAMGETPSANANCSARGLAKIAAMMSCGGTMDDKEYLSERAWAAMHKHPTSANMGGLLATRFTQGGINKFTACSKDSATTERALNAGREGFYGWMGLGGSLFQWHPQLDIGFAFVPTSLHVLDLFNERGKAYQAEVVRCVQEHAQ